jgi:hypothetical protein
VGPASGEARRSLRHDSKPRVRLQLKTGYIAEHKQRERPHPQTRLGYEILPYLRAVDDREWMSEEREFLDWAERARGRPRLLYTRASRVKMSKDTRSLRSLRAPFS